MRRHSKLLLLLGATACFLATQARADDGEGEGGSEGGEDGGLPPCSWVDAPMAGRCVPDTPCAYFEDPTAQPCLKWCSEAEQGGEGQPTEECAPDPPPGCSELLAAGGDPWAEGACDPDTGCSEVDPPGSMPCWDDRPLCTDVGMDENGAYLQDCIQVVMEDYPICPPDVERDADGNPAVWCIDVQADTDLPFCSAVDKDEAGQPVEKCLPDPPPFCKDVPHDEDGSPTQECQPDPLPLCSAVEHDETGEPVEKCDPDPLPPCSSVPHDANGIPLQPCQKDPPPPCSEVEADQDGNMPDCWSWPVYQPVVPGRPYYPPNKYNEQFRKPTGGGSNAGKGGGKKGPCGCAKTGAGVCAKSGRVFPNKCALNCAKAQQRFACQPGTNCAKKCEAAKKKDKGCFCMEIFAPVCGLDGKLYPNACKAKCAKKKTLFKCANPNNTRRCAKKCKKMACVCPEIYGPVCGADGKIYENDCKAKCSTKVTHKCPNLDQVPKCAKACKALASKHAVSRHRWYF